MTQSGPGYPRKYYCVGTQLLWIPKKIISQLDMVMKQSIPQHLNGFFSKNMDIKVELLDKKIQIDKKHKYVSEIEHTSLTLDNTRKGKRESSILRDKNKSTKQQFLSDMETVRLVRKSNVAKRSKKKNNKPKYNFF